MKSRNKARALELAQFLADNNIRIKEWAKNLGKGGISKIHAYVQNPKAPKLTDEQRAWLQTMPQGAIRLIRQVADYARELLQIHRKFIYKIAYNYATRTGQIGKQERDDLDQEAVVSFLHATRYYTDVNFNFLTYIGTSIKRWLRRVNLKAGGQEEMLARFFETERLLTVAGEKHDFEAVVEKMGISKKRQRSLWHSLRTPIQEDSLRLDGEPATIAEVACDKTTRGLDYDLIEVISMVQMTDIERDSFISQTSIRGMFPKSFDSLREVAKKYGVSNQAANYAVERAQKKLQRRLNIPR